MKSSNINSTEKENDPMKCACTPRFPQITVAECEDVWVKDTNGRTYIDFTSGAHTCNIGHKHPEVMAAVRKEQDRTGISPLGIFLNNTRNKLAGKIAEIAPVKSSKRRVGFCNTGSDATELSVRLARRYTGRFSIMCFFGSSHGQSTTESLAMNTSPGGTRRHGLPVIPGIITVPFPYCYRCLFSAHYPDCRFKCLDFIRYELETGVVLPDQVAAFFIEPVQLHGGVIPFPDGYPEELAKLCQEHSILLVVDEVATGSGRTGRMFGIENWHLFPDILYTAKSIAAGMSLGAIVAGDEIMSNFKGGGTFSGNPVACAAALANISVIENHNLLQRCKQTSEYIVTRLRDMSLKHEIIGDIRAKGLLIGVELVQDKKNKTPATTETRTVIKNAAKEGLLMFPAGVYNNVLRITPPLTTTEEIADQALNILDKSLRLVES